MPSSYQKSRTPLSTLSQKHSLPAAVKQTGHVPFQGERDRGPAQSRGHGSQRLGLDVSGADLAVLAGGAAPVRAGLLHRADPDRAQGQSPAGEWRGTMVTGDGDVMDFHIQGSSGFSSQCVTGH